MKLEKIEIKLELIEPILGSCPKNKDVYESYIVEKMRKDVDNEKLDVKELKKRGVEELETIQETEEKGWTGFHCDSEGIFIYDYVIRGMLKNAGKALKYETEIKNSASKIDQYVFVFPRVIHFKNSGKFVKEPHGTLERPLRAMTMQGPRVTLAKSDMLNSGVTLEFNIKLVPNPDITVKKIQELFEYGELCGLGQFRNGSYGRFVVKEFNKV
jgi:hypothetical protein